jgi:hypothetical protein
MPPVVSEPAPRKRSDACGAFFLSFAPPLIMEAAGRHKTFDILDAGSEAFLQHQNFVSKRHFPAHQHPTASRMDAPA